MNLYYTDEFQAMRIREGDASLSHRVEGRVGSRPQAPGPWSGAIRQPRPDSIGSRIAAATGLASPLATRNSVISPRTGESGGLAIESRSRPVARIIHCGGKR